jgi:hypothetical protein
MFDAVNGLGCLAMFLARGRNFLAASLSRALTIAVRTQLLRSELFEQAGCTFANTREL